jgi:hypothetical protein
MKNQGNCNDISIVVPSWYNEIMESYKHDFQLQEIITEKSIGANNNVITNTLFFLLTWVSGPTCAHLN